MRLGAELLMGAIEYVDSMRGSSRFKSFFAQTVKGLFRTNVIPGSFATSSCYVHFVVHIVSNTKLVPRGAS